MLKKSSKKPLFQRFKISYLAMLVALILLAISALPNLYPAKSWLHVTAQQQVNAELLAIDTQKSVVDFLNQHGFTVEQSMQSSQQQSSLNVLLHEPTKSAAAQQALKSEFTQLNVKIVTHQTSPDWLQSLGLAPIKLGLDLNGGVLFVLDVDLVKAQQEQLDSAYEQTKTIIRDEKARGVRVQQNAQGFELHALPAAKDQLLTVQTQVLKRFQRLAPTVHTQGKLTTVAFSFSEQGSSEFTKEVMSQTLTTLRGRIEELGITEAVTQRQGKQRIRIELPGVQDPAAAKRIIGATASLDFHQLKEYGGKSFALQNGGTISLDPIAIFSGQHINNAHAGRDEWGKPLVQLSLDSQGGEAMSAFSKRNIGKPMATVYSEYYKNDQGKVVKKSEVINVANIAQHLSSQFSITNMQSPQAAQDLALLLRAGSLTAPVTIVQEQTIGPSLGADNINNGLAALMLGMGITLAFMALWYRRLGLVANIALLLNLTALVGLMSLLPGVVLTLPGIAGLVLTIGMAVDTNVIIFERIKEERRKGRAPYQAIEQGYKQAFSTIFDANITTMITAVILYGIGYGPVKGFAITLALGLITSVFTGVYVSKALSQTVYLKLANKRGVNA
ncbi:protein translocase subunit SecD [Pseudoalteromonas haloplanktis]|uniref:Protein translocase subunit SecD n=1 Tax=Pseudoalteromonas haloplanktis TaxID=228 RepID=A0ABU1BA99_PSEHA|nr:MULTISPECIES: protein translocase subunit SecD [Pseudoalteromonas]MDQ9090537.1 protein translocase subunit SecD [Pseudoalteromonas haloplanktis]TMN74319.1 protein translocase subunit SecD [Pseudoalteromonas sp. S1727]